VAISAGFGGAAAQLTIGSALDAWDPTGLAENPVD
jgi:hypothetical protein